MKKIDLGSVAYKLGALKGKRSIRVNLDALEVKDILSKRSTNDLLKERYPTYYKKILYGYKILKTLDLLRQPFGRGGASLIISDKYPSSVRFDGKDTIFRTSSYGSIYGGFKLKHSYSGNTWSFEKRIWREYEKICKLSGPGSKSEYEKLPNLICFERVFSNELGKIIKEKGLSKVIIEKGRISNGKQNIFFHEDYGYWTIKFRD